MSEKWGHGVNCHPPNWRERPTGEYRESQLIRAETQEHISRREPVPWWGKLSYNLRDKNYKGPSQKSPHTLWVLSVDAQSGSHSEYQRKIALCFWHQEGKGTTVSIFVLFLSSPSGIPITCILYLLQLSYHFRIFFSLLSFFSLRFSFGSFY